MNMIWNYSLNLTIITPLEWVKNTTNASSLSKLYMMNVIQNTANRVGKDVLGYTQRIIG
jgi:hypothetical protein